MSDSNKSVNRNEEGIVAIVVTVIVLLVITLTALGLARLARREQRQTLDRQLSAEAFYVAESGVNDAIAAINDPLNNWHLNNRDTCNASPDVLPPVSNKIDMLTNPQGAFIQTLVNGTLLPNLGIGASEGEYSCVLIKHDIEAAEYSSIGVSKSTYADITSVDSNGANTPLETLTFGWQAEDNANNNFRPATSTEFPIPTVWNNDTGVLRVDVTDLNGASNGATNLAYRTNTFYLYPNDDPGAGAPITAPLAGGFGTLPADKGLILDGKCHPTSTTNGRLRKCNVVIDIPTPVAPSCGCHYFVRMKSIYNPTRVSFSSGISGTKLKGVQTQIDSTGKVADVLKRIQVRVPRTANAGGDNSFPEYAIESVNGICKRTHVRPGSHDFNSLNVPAAPNPDRLVCDPDEL